jgi:hypothetical protein
MKCRHEVLSWDGNTIPCPEVAHLYVCMDCGAKLTARVYLKGDDDRTKELSASGNQD